MLGNYFAAAIDVVLYLGTTRGHGLLAPLHVVTELLFAGIDVGVDLRSCFFGFLLQVFGAFACTLGKTFPRFCPRLRSVKHTDCRADSEPDQKPTETTAAATCPEFRLTWIFPLSC